METRPISSPKGPWLTDPRVQLNGPMAREFTYTTDGEASRIKRKPVFGSTPEGPTSWPESKKDAPWLIEMPVELPEGQTLITDGLVAWTKQKPRPSFGSVSEGNAKPQLEPTPTPTPGTPTPTPPPATPTPTPTPGTPTPPPTTPTPTPTPTPPPTTPTPPPTQPPPTTAPPPEPFAAPMAMKSPSGAPKTRAELSMLFSGHGVELGVAAGEFSAVILRNKRCKRLWSIDRWSDHHGAEEYRKASAELSRISQGRCVPLRMTFSEAAGTFPDGSLDFIYIDGYAHTGQENGQTLEQWWPKLRQGGIISGHDYHPKYQKTIDAVDAFVAKHKLALHLTEEGHGSDAFPSWWAVKPGAYVPPKQIYSPEKVMTGSPVQDGESVLLVGNGPSMTTRGDRGEWVDSFDQVIRFNWFAIRGFEKQVGTKTTLWSTFGRGSLPKDDDQRPRRAVFIHGDKPKNFAYPVAEAWGVHREFFDEVRERVKTRSKIPAESRKKDLLPSSGLVVTLWLLEIHHVPKVDLVGFDHFSKKENGGHHYWINRVFGRPPEHDGDAEAEIFDELEADGRITRH